MSLQLDAEQTEAASVPADRRQIVVAGPGSGKTEVVAALVEHLAGVEDVDPADEVIVLSFSNAAVHAVARRLRSDDRPSPEVRTVDSLAREIILEESVDELPTNLDQRIVVATGLLENEGWRRLDSLTHLVIDEVQDLVGVRADLVLELLRLLPEEAGFTLLGDPAQGIYDFQIGQTSSTSSSDFLNAAARFGGVSRVELQGQYRARTRDAQQATALRDSVLEGNLEDAIGDYVASIAQVGLVSEVGQIAQRWSGTTAFLTHDNGEALLVASALAEGGLSVDLRRSAHTQVPARWLSDVLGSTASGMVARTDFLQNPMHGKDNDAAERWRSLRRIAPSYGPNLEVAKVVSALRSGRRLPPVLLEPQDSRLVVSTVHRAKGLEFDNVILIDPRDRHSTDKDHAADARLRFVALTRARDRVLRATGPDSQRVYRDSRSGRWFRGGYKKGVTFGFQIGHGDVDVSAPAAGGRATQIYLGNQVSSGDAVDLELDLTWSTLEIPFYRVSHDGRAVGYTSAGFAETLTKRIGSAQSRGFTYLPWPLLRGARVDQIVTAAGAERPGDEVGARGLWLAPTLVGLLSLKWKADDDE